MTNMEKRHVFGPVPSRRLGRSLGVDLVPHKTCTYNCLYCQLGLTTNLTVKRGAFTDVDALLREIERKLQTTPPPDYITLSGSGEPTLQCNLDALIAGIKRITDIPVAALTNGSLLWCEDVRSELLEADLVIPSLDAGDANLFERVNRPHSSLHFEDIVEGLIEFRRVYTGKIWLEVFLLDGISTTDEQILKLKDMAHCAAPDRIQLNTVARPPCESIARPASAEALEHAAQMFGEKAEIIAEHPSAGIVATAAPDSADIVELLRRRPCTLDDLAAGLGTHRLEVVKRIDPLLHNGTLVMRQYGRRIYIQPANRVAQSGAV